MKKILAFTLITLSLSILGLRYFSQQSSMDKTSDKVVVYQSKTCGCCKKWVGHLEKNGFKVTSQYLDDVTEVKLKMKVPMKLASCHTATVNGYIVEGHVPASAIKKLLSEKPAIKGIAVPGMPMGSPGMEGGYKESYNVMAFDNNGSDKIFLTF